MIGASRTKATLITGLYRHEIRGKVRGERNAVKIVHLALGGCLKAPPVTYGLTADTGGHITYILAAAQAQAWRDPSLRITLATRRFYDMRLGAIHSVETEQVGPTIKIQRIETANPAYLEKEALAPEISEFTRRFVQSLENARRLPSLIHAHFADAAAVALHARDRFGIPFVYTPHALALDKVRLCRVSRARLRKRICAERRAIQTADAIIVSSVDEAERQLAAYAITDFAKRTHIIAPGVPKPTQEERLMPPLTFADAYRPLLLAIARPTERKNLVAIAEAFAGSSLRRTANLVILAGQHASAAHSAEEQGVLDRLHSVLASSIGERCAALPPRHSSADVWALYRQAASTRGVFVSPALHEPFGLTLLEAASVGLPVVATAHGGASDIVRKLGNGLIAEPRDNAELAKRCLKVITNAALHRRLSKAGMRAPEIFSWDRYAQHSLQLYQSLMVPADCHDAVAA